MLTGSRFTACAGGAAMVAAALVLPTAAIAGTASSSMSVTATVTATCTVSTTALAFGSVDTISGLNVDNTGSLSVTCTNGSPWTASAGVGAGVGASYANRKMTSGANLLNYNLYTTAARTVVWGNNTGGTAFLSGTGTGAVQSVTVYGRVNSGQTGVPAGAYTDTVAVTVTY